MHVIWLYLFPHDASGLRFQSPSHQKRTERHSGTESNQWQLSFRDFAGNTCSLSNSGKTNTHSQLPCTLVHDALIML